MICIYYQEIDNQSDISAIKRPFQVWKSNNRIYPSKSVIYILLASKLMKTEIGNNTFMILQ